jgi:hypothetical protein
MLEVLRSINWSLALTIACGLLLADVIRWLAAILAKAVNGGKA